VGVEKGREGEMVGEEEWDFTPVLLPAPTADVGVPPRCICVAEIEGEMDGEGEREREMEGD
jgi:hypothetical protein